MVGRGIARTVLLTGLALAATACVQTQKLDSNSAKISGRPVAILNNPAKSMAIGTDPQSTLSTGQSAGVGLAVGLVDVALKASTGTYQRAAQVAHPSIDPTRVVEDKLLSELAQRYRATPSGRLSLTAKPFTANGNWPDRARVASIAADAKSKGFGGLVLDIVPVRSEALTQGHALTIGGPKLVFSYIANIALIDAADGNLLMSGFCASASGRNTHRLNAVLEGGQSFVDAEIRQIANSCATEMSRKTLRHN